MPSCVILDLSAVTFMDCTGLQVLIAARHAAAVARRELRLRNVPDRVQRLFELTDLYGLFADASAARGIAGDLSERVAHPSVPIDGDSLDHVCGRRSGGGDCWPGCAAQVRSVVMSMPCGAVLV